jgi:hypothetical protein
MIRLVFGHVILHLNNSVVEISQGFDGLEDFIWVVILAIRDFLRFIANSQLRIEDVSNSTGQLPWLRSLNTDVEFPAILWV